eukprot:TRINITY_DN11132_c0_g1_i1.p1 TRINITY_DN11132_c0_g1~~TRINITY_DN11132_c0_g1_i1.p1  ORF type:complete len:171 (-),score=17.58 TRINITY_DN11132_c0_g1_i1:219-731(-)
MISSACVAKTGINHESLSTCQICVCTGCDGSGGRSRVSSLADQLLLIDVAMLMKSADHDFRVGSHAAPHCSAILVETERKTNRPIFWRRAGISSLRVQSVQTIRAPLVFSASHYHTANQVASSINAAFKFLSSVVCCRSTTAQISNRALGEPLRHSIIMIPSRRAVRMRV